MMMSQFMPVYQPPQQQVFYHPQPQQQTTYQTQQPAPAYQYAQHGGQQYAVMPMTPTPAQMMGYHEQQANAYQVDPEMYGADSRFQSQGGQNAKARARTTPPILKTSHSIR